MILALLPLAFSPSKGAIMEVGGVTECPAEGGMYNCRQMSVDFDALLAAEEVTIEGSGALVGLVFGRDITISRDQVYEGHMYTYTVSELVLPKSICHYLAPPAFYNLAQHEVRKSQNSGTEILKEQCLLLGSEGI